MRKRALLVVALLVAAVLAITACGDLGKGSASGTKGAAAKKGQELAKVGDTMITVEEFESRLEKIPPFYKKRLATMEGKKDFLNRMVLDELYYLEALRRGLDNDPEYLEQLESIKRNILATKIKKEILEKDIAPSDDEIQKYYEENKEEFKVPETLNLRHILIKVARNATDQEIAKAKATADKAYAKIKAGAKFEAVAEEFSDDKTSAKKGGEIPPVRKGVKSPEFDEAAWKLTKPGEVSPVFKDRRGFNILQFVSKTEESVKEFDKVKDQIKRKLETEKRKTALDAYNEELKAKNPVVIHEDLLAKIGPKEEEAAPAPTLGTEGAEGTSTPAPAPAPGQAPAAGPAPAPAHPQPAAEEEGGEDED